MKKILLKYRVLVSATFVAAITTLTAPAQTLTLIDAQTASGGVPTTSGTGTDQSPTNLINNSGMSSTALGTPGSVVTINTSDLPTANEQDESGGGVPGGFRATYTNVDNSPIVFNLNTGVSGSPTGYSINGLYIYNFGENYQGQNQTPGGNTVSLDLLYSIDGGVTYSDYGTVNLLPATTTSLNDPGASYLLSTTLNNVTDLEFNNLTSSPTSTNVGLAEVRFEEAAAPEPSTWVLLFSGITALGGLSFFRHRAARLS